MGYRSVIAVGVAAAAGLGGWAVWPPADPPPPDWASTYDVTAGRPESLAAGLVVDKTAPAGWSHLILKTRPKIRDAERGKVAAITATWAEWMFTAFAADVAPDGSPGNPPHRLRAVALGLGSRTEDGHDTILTPDAAEKLKPTWPPTTVLGPVQTGRMILQKGYEVQGRSVVVLHGSTMGLVDVPTYFRCGDRHRLVRYRYALLVDPPSGRLDTLLWGLDDGGCFNGPATATRLPRDAVADVGLVVDAKEFNLIGVPSEAAFAVDQLPAGTGTVEFPAALRPLVAAGRFTADDARTLEAGLRKLIAP